MKTIGLLGGLTWESSAEYYRLINEMVFERLGGRHSAGLYTQGVFSECPGRTSTRPAFDAAIYQKRFPANQFPSVWRKPVYLYIFQSGTCRASSFCGGACRVLWIFPGRFPFKRNRRHRHIFWRPNDRLLFLYLAR